jgi:hypothetical protein
VKRFRRNRESHRRNLFNPINFPPSEIVCHKAGELLLKQKKIDFFIHAHLCDKLDQAHIDFLFCKKRKLVAIQVKGHPKAACKHMAKYPLIPILIISNSAPTDQNIRTTAKEILRIIAQERSHEEVFDTHTVDIIHDRIKAEGYLAYTNFPQALSK